MSAGTCSILLVEDDPGHAHLAERALAKRECQFSVCWVGCLQDALDQLSVRGFDVALVDLNLSDSSGLETVRRLRRQSADLPLVVLTSCASSALAREALEQGAQDYLPKDMLVADRWGSEALERSIRHAICRQHSAAENRRLVTRLRRKRRLLKQQNRRLARLYKTGQLVVENVSHEFRTPLTVIQEYVSLVRDGMFGDVNREQGQTLDVVADRTEDLNRMVDDMLDVTMLDAGLLMVRRSRCSVAEIVDRVAPTLRRKAAIKGVTFDLAIDASLDDVYCDVDKARRVIANLAVNAIKFCHAVGRVELWARDNPQCGEIIVGVSDDGQGIADDDLPRVFERFARVGAGAYDSARGFGLGLAAAKELVHLNLGEISATSEPNRGSTFSFTLPKADATEILGRHLDRTADATSASLVVVDVAAPRADGTLDEIDTLVNRLLSANDAAFRSRPSRWIVLLAGDARGGGRFQRKATHAWKHRAGSRARRALPEMNFHALGTWRLPAERQRLLDVAAQATSGDPAPAECATAVQAELA